MPHVTFILIDTAESEGKNWRVDSHRVSGELYAPEPCSRRVIQEVRKRIPAGIGLKHMKQKP